MPLHDHLKKSIDELQAQLEEEEGMHMGSPDLWTVFVRISCSFFHTTTSFVSLMSVLPPKNMYTLRHGRGVLYGVAIWIRCTLKIEGMEGPHVG